MINSSQTSNNTVNQSVANINFNIQKKSLIKKIENSKKKLNNIYNKINQQNKNSPTPIMSKKLNNLKKNKRYLNTTLTDLDKITQKSALMKVNSAVNTINNKY